MSDEPKPLTEAQVRELGDRLAGVCDGAVDEVAAWIEPVVARIAAKEWSAGYKSGYGDGLNSYYADRKATS